MALDDRERNPLFSLLEGTDSIDDGRGMERERFQVLVTLNVHPCCLAPGVPTPLLAWCRHHHPVLECPAAAPSNCLVACGSAIFLVESALFPPHRCCAVDAPRQNCWVVLGRWSRPARRTAGGRPQAPNSVGLTIAETGRRQRGKRAGVLTRCSTRVLK